MNIKYCVIIQCDIAHKRCSGFACTNAFYNKDEKFKCYDETVRYISFTCGGCCGKGVSSKLEHFSKHLKKINVNKEEVVVHLSSCMTTDNYHYDRCPHIDYVKNIITKKGFMSVVEGTYVSKGASRKRETGVYKSYNI
ncbi:MAG TPA: CGGC domain-containing protein [Clostridia bacterium]